MSEDNVVLTRDTAAQWLGASHSKVKMIAAWVWWLPPAALSLTLALVFADPFAGEWDALDYTVLGVLGRPSSMVLGRSLFLLFNHSLWYVAHSFFDLQPENAYVLFKYAVIFQSPLAIIACWRLSHDLTNSLQAASLSVLLLLLSPFFILYSGQVMTEIPSILLLAVALTIHLSGLHTRRLTMVLLGAALLGASVNVREAALLYFPWLIIGPYSCGWRWKWNEIRTTIIACMIFVLCAFGPFLFLLASDFGGYNAAWHGWLESTRMESARHPVSLDNFRLLLRYFVVAAPLTFVVFPIALFLEIKLRGLTPLATLAIIGLVANCLLIFHYSAVINGRYMLTGLPAITPLVARYLIGPEKALDKRRRLSFIFTGIGVIVTSVVIGYYTWPFTRTYLEHRALAKDYRNQLAEVPRDAIMISGGQSVAVTYWRGLGAGEWEVISSGSRWPGASLNSVIANCLAQGNRVFLDADPRWWLIDGWQRDELPELANIQSNFRFRQVSKTIYEITTPDDETARDLPELLLRLRENGPNVNNNPSVDGPD
jgi:hypothetical protein